VQIGPDISLSVAGVAVPGGSSTPRSILDWVAAQRVRALAIDGTAPGFRARELGRSARRDLAASLRRRELDFAGLDLWIPPNHFSDPEQCQRAIEAAVAGAELSAELAQLVGGRSLPSVSIMTSDSIDDAILQALGEQASRNGATIIDHRAHKPGSLHAGVALGVDPASVLFAGGDPQQAVHDAGKHLAAVRLDDVNAMGRCPVGAEGARLDIAAYKAAIVLGSLDWITVDLRQLPEPGACLTRAREAWGSALELPGSP
jgi:sugar phosphate isomerase/epimerase